MLLSSNIPLVSGSELTVDLAGGLWEGREKRDVVSPAIKMRCMNGIIPLSPGSAMEKRRAGRGTPVLRLMLNLRGPKPESAMMKVFVLCRDNLCVEDSGRGGGGEFE